MNTGEIQNFVDTVKDYLEGLTSIDTRTDIPDSEKIRLKNITIADFYGFLSQPDAIQILLRRPRLRDVVDLKAEEFIDNPYISANAKENIDQYHRTSANAVQQNAGKRKSKKTSKRKNRKTRRRL
jgi:hypothetical protein